MIVAISSPQPRARYQQCTPEESSGAHPFRAGFLQSRDVDRAVACGNNNAVDASLHDIAWLAFALAYRYCAPDFQRRSVPRRDCARHRIKCAHLATDLDGAAPPIDLRFSFAD